MNNEEIVQARNEYKILEEERRVLIKLKNKMNELSKNDRVAEYINLCDKLNLLSDIQIPTTEELVHQAFNDIAIKTSSPCKIYLYLGLKLDQTHSYLGSAYKLTNDERRIYKNLDTGFVFNNYAQKKDIFQANNEIINCFDIDAEEKFNKIRNDYFLNLLKYDAEKAIQKTLTKHKGK